jgi:uncharacterized protein (TIGR02453 family)
VGFSGWPAEAFDFFEGLEADNTKSYWTEHKPLYERAVRAPMEALLEDLAGEFGPGRIFRPYRDVRFSTDKSPYKENIAAVSHPPDGAVYYVSLSSAGLFVATGYYQPATDQLDRYRRAVVAPAGEELERIVAGLERSGHEVGGEALKRAPRGYPADHPRARLLRHKGVTTARSFPPARWMGSAKARERVAEVWRAGGPLNAWLLAHVGPSDLER